MINEKIDHHFNELSPLDFNVFGDTNLYDKIRREEIDLKTAHAFLNHVTVIKEQIDSVVGEEDEHLAVVYNFLSETEQKQYQNFLERLEVETRRYIEKIAN
jgi:hypothetical protein